MMMPCESVIWNILPAIRRELTRSLVYDIGIKQRQAAQLIGMTDAAVSQYLSGKRGKYLITDPEILDDIGLIAHQIYNGKELTKHDICQVCIKIRKNEERNATLPGTIDVIQPLDSTYEIIQQSQELTHKE